MIELNVMDMIRKLLKKWKVIAVIILLGLILGAVVSIVSGKAYVIVNKDDSSDFALENASANLSDEQKVVVENNYHAYISLNKQRKNISERLNSSIFFNLDKDNSMIKMLYYVSMNNEDSSILDAWKDFVCSKDVLEAINQEVDHKLTQNDLYDLIKYAIKPDVNEKIYIDNNKEGMILNIYIYGEDDQQCEVIAKYVKKGVDTFFNKTVNDITQTSVKLLSEEKKQIQMALILEDVRIFSDRLNSINNALTSLKNSMSDAEILYYRTLIEQKIQKDDDISKPAEPRKLLSKKRLVLYMMECCILFTGLYIFFFLLMYILGGKLHKMDQICSMYGLNMLCSAGFDEADTAFAEIKYLAQKDSNEKIGIVTTCKDASVKKLMDHIILKDEDKQIISLECRPQTEEDFEKMNSVKGIVVFEKEEASMMKEISQMISYYKNKNIPIEGAILVK